MNTSLSTVTTDLPHVALIGLFSEPPSCTPAPKTGEPDPEFFSTDSSDSLQGHCGTCGRRVEACNCQLQNQ